MNEDRARAVGAGRVGGRTFMPRTDVPVTIGRLVCWRAGASAAVAPGYNNMMQKTRARRGKIFWPSTISDGGKPRRRALLAAAVMSYLYRLLAPGARHRFFGGGS